MLAMMPAGHHNAVKSLDGGKDHLVITAKPIYHGLRYRVELEEGLLKLLNTARCRPRASGPAAGRRPVYRPTPVGENLNLCLTLATTSPACRLPSSPRLARPPTFTTPRDHPRRIADLAGLRRGALRPEGLLESGDSRSRPPPRGAGRRGQRRRNPPRVGRRLCGRRRSAADRLHGRHLRPPRPSTWRRARPSTSTAARPT